MKTTILISSIAALSLMININEPDSRRAAENNVNSNLHISSAVPTKVCVEPDEKQQLTIKKAVVETPPALIPENFNYLKFNINDYTRYTEVSSFEDFDLPENDFGYLRFDVDNYIDPIAGSPEYIELPADDYSYLKFDVNVYVGRNEQENASNSEQPVAETQF